MSALTYPNSLSRSVLIHVALAALVLAITFRPHPSDKWSSSEEIPFEVIDAPRVAPMPLQPSI
ncbi:hypothetical protein EBZ37_04235, partial [bacterium]|nr:hypothetical protein [bacterium]